MCNEVISMTDREIFQRNLRYYLEDMNKSQSELAKYTGASKQTKYGEYLLTGKLFCGTCGEALTGYSGTAKSGKLYRYYFCKPHKCTKYPKDDLERIIASSLHDIVLDDDCITWMAQNAVRMASESSEADTAQSISDRIETAQKAQINIMKSIERGLSSELLENRFRELETEIENLKTKLEIAKQNAADQLTEDDIISFLTLFRDGDASDPVFEKSLFDAFLLKAVLFDDHVKVAFSVKKEDRTEDIPLPGTDEIESSSKTLKWRCKTTNRTQLYICNSVFWLQVAV